MSQYIFFGTIIPGQPPLYLRLYVDDFYYFGESTILEKKFEQDFGSEIDIAFNCPVDYFLGIFFTHHWDDNNNVTIHLGQYAFIDNLVLGINSYLVSLYPIFCYFSTYLWVLSDCSPNNLPFVFARIL